MSGVHTWWKKIPGERFWLGVVARDREGEWLAVPCEAGRYTSAGRNPLIKHVMDGDTVFHYDPARQAIVAWSTSRGRARKRPLIWSRRARGEASESAAARVLPSWVIGLEKSTPLDNVVPLDHIARVQWDLFPALRAFEDRVGEPLYYPFAMGSSSDSSLLAGHVFKLPALFVECFPELRGVAEHLAWSTAAHRSTSRRGTRAEIPAAGVPMRA